MSQATTLILLPQTSYTNPGNGAPYTVIGNSQQAASYYVSSRDLQTINMSLANVTGNIVIQATLATTPLDSDWFDTYTVVANTTAAPNSAPLLASNGATFTNITGSFVYVRAVVEDFATGVVNFIKISY